MVDKFLDFLIKVIQLFWPDLKKWIVRALVLAGLSLIVQPVWEPLLQSALEKYFQLRISIPETEVTGWVLLTVGVLLYLANLHVEHISKPREVRTPAPVLSLDFEDTHPFVYTEPSSAKGRAIRAYRVRVTNTGTNDLEKCIVYLHEMTSLTNPQFKNAYVPTPLVTQKQLQEGRQGGEFKLRIGQPKYIEVAWLDENLEDSEIVLRYAHRTTPNPVKRDDYILTLVAYGGGSPVSGQFRLNVDEGGFLRFQRYVPTAVSEKPWVEEAVVVDRRWPVASGFQQAMAKQGFALRWSKPDKTATRLAGGYEIMYEYGTKSHTKRQIMLRDGSILIGKKA